MTALVQIAGLGVQIGGNAVLSDVALEIRSRRVLGLVGETGSGKSLTCRALLGLLARIGGSVTAGTIRFDGVDLVDADAGVWSELRGHRIGFIPQASLNALDPVSTVGAQLQETIRVLDRGAAVRERAIELLKMVEMPDPERVLRLYPHQLSGGMRQRVMIALALVGRPSLLVADEPTTALDVTVQQAILEVLAGLRDSEGMSVLLVTHDLGVIADIADDIAVMYAGTVVERGATRDVLTDPKHPYTRALLGARPRMGERDRELATIPGQPATPGSWTPGCRFAPRCQHAQPVCTQSEPRLLAVGASSNHDRACHGWPANPAEEATRG
jgi:oligopeptide/dipeptide ABC transporter ATP-binding protein